MVSWNIPFFFFGCTSVSRILNIMIVIHHYYGTIMKAIKNEDTDRELELISALHMSITRILIYDILTILKHFKNSKRLQGQVPCIKWKIKNPTLIIPASLQLTKKIHLLDLIVWTIICLVIKVQNFNILATTCSGIVQLFLNVSLILCQVYSFLVWL